ncbi:type II toxin-antitoxin system RelE/ParE family toxin [bacterium]|nr:type II toxin-antitoxin system RelE/ParE family toxin [bacterium]
MYELVIKPRAEKEFKKLPAKLKKRFYVEFKKLSTDPFAYPQIKRISGTKFGWRLRVGRWRILFALFSKERKIEIVDIFLKKSKGDYLKRRKLF